MRKIFFLLFFVSILSGCLKNTSDSNPIVLTVWEYDNISDEFIQQAGEEYKKKHPNITVRCIHVEFDELLNQIVLDGPVGLGPDLFPAPHEKLGELVNGGVVAPTVDSKEVERNVLGVCSKAVTYNGTMYGYPLSAETYALFYNKDLISERDIPKTWQDLVEFSKRFNAANWGKTAFVMDVDRAYYTIMFTTMNGNCLFGSLGTDTAQSNINSSDAIKGMTFFQNNIRPIIDIPLNAVSSINTDRAFADGAVAMYISGAWNIGFFQDAGVNFGVATLPSLPNEKKPSSSCSTIRAMFVSEYSEHKNEAADFANFLLTQKMQRLRFEIAGSIPSVNLKLENPCITGFIRQLNYAFPAPSVPQAKIFWEAFGNASKNIWDGADVKTELDAANAVIIGL